jgi:hypothetical protein
MALSKRDKRLLLVSGVVMVLALGFLLLRATSGTQSDDPEVTRGPADPAAAAASPAPAPTPSPTQTAPEALVFQGRDPFLPLISPGSVSSGTVQIVDPNSLPVTTEGNVGHIHEHVVTLLDLLEEGGVQKANVVAESVTYTVAVGEEFANYFKLVSVNGTCASFLHGDEPFTLCEAAA